MGETIRACIGLGANLGDAAATLEGGIRALAALPGARLRAVSRLYATAPGRAASARIPPSSVVAGSPTLAPSPMYARTRPRSSLLRSLHSAA